VSLNDGSKEVENGESLIYFAAWSPVNEIVPTPLCVRGYNVPWLIRGQLELYTLVYTNTNPNPNPNVHKT